MRCERCQGIGKLTYDQLTPQEKGYMDQFGSVFPCPDCGGCGISHCCDGLTAENDCGETTRDTTSAANTEGSS